MKNKLGCSTHCYNRFSFDRALEGIAKVGLEYVEIGAIPGHCDHVKPELMSKKQFKELKHKITSYGLKPLSISGHCDLTSEIGVELFKKRIDLAYEMEVSIVNTAGGNIENIEQEESFFTKMKIITKYLEERGIVAALEIHGGIIGTGSMCRKTIERINSSNVRINYDPANLIYFEGKRPEDDIMDIIDYVAHFHIKDKLEGKGVWNFPAIGEGYINFTSLFDVLFNNYYEGPLSFEIEFVENGPKAPEEVDEALEKSLKYIRQLKGRNWSLMA